MDYRRILQPESWGLISIDEEDVKNGVEENVWTPKQKGFSHGIHFSNATDSDAGPDGG